MSEFYWVEEIPYTNKNKKVFIKKKILILLINQLNFLLFFFDAGDASDMEQTLNIGYSI
jgi:hypothetical protein